MITVYQKTIRDSKLKKLKKFKVGSWVMVEEPIEEEIVSLAKTYKLEEGHLRDAVDLHEVPRLEVESTGTYIYTRVPHQEGGTVTTLPLLVVIGKDFVMTVSPKSAAPLKRFVESKLQFNTTQKIKFVLQIFTEVMASYGGFLMNINRRVRALSVKLEQISNADIVQFVQYERVLNDFIAALVPTNTILRNLLSGRYFKLYEEDEDLIEDLMLSNGQLVETCSSNLKNMVNIREAYSTIMTNNLNRVIKVLTALTIILTVPTIISSFYGMNVILPGMELAEAFWYILGGTVVVVALLLVVFKHNRWL